MTWDAAACKLQLYCVMFTGHGITAAVVSQYNTTFQQQAMAQRGASSSSLEAFMRIFLLGSRPFAISPKLD